MTGARAELRAESPGYSAATKAITVEATPVTARLDLVQLMDAGAAAAPVDAPPVVTQPTKQAPKRGGKKEPRPNNRGSASETGTGSNAGFSPNDVL